MTFLKSIILAAAFLAVSFTAAFAQTTVQRFYTTYEFTGPMAQNSKALSFNSSNWVWPGDVLSTSVKSIPANFGSFAHIVDARLVVVWVPQPGAVLRLIKADSGPINIVNINPWIYPTVTGSPTVSAANVTTGLQAVFDGGTWKQIGIQLSGSGILNRATLEVVWEVEVPDDTELTDRVDTLEARVTALEAAAAP